LLKISVDTEQTKVPFALRRECMLVFSHFSEKLNLGATEK
jgi:hypothetical protein